MPIILVFASVGAYSINTSLTDVVMVLLFGVLGFFMRWSGVHAGRPGTGNGLG